MVERLVSRWRGEADVLRARAAAMQAEVLESCAADLEVWFEEYALEALTLAQAAEESGFTYSALEKQVRKGNLPNAGTIGSPRVRRGDLPKKGGRANNDGLADLILRSRS
jgi:hypothetical protein